MDAEAILQRLQSAEVQNLPLSAIKTDEAFQPRLECVLPYSVRVGTKQRSDDHVACMRLHLEASQAAELEPVLAAPIDRKVFLVDGHHRLRAYRVANRETIPARLCPLSHPEAVFVSKLANCVPRSLALMPAQRREAAWQWMTVATNHWRRSLADGHSYRTIGSRFGVDKSTVMAMVKRGRKISAADWDEAECDPGTGFPRWDVVKRAEWALKNGMEELTMEKATELRASKLATQIGHLMYGIGTDVRRKVWQKLAEDQKQWLEDADFLSLAHIDLGDEEGEPDF